uniref:Ferritin n=1 Tax=Cyprinus carpio carpio TaxID=630221 RepID=A0A8C1C0U3_CYPCA
MQIRIAALLRVYSCVIFTTPLICDEQTRLSECFQSFPYRFCYLQTHYFERDDVALPGFAKFFKKNSEEEREHAEKFMEFQNKRGGRIMLQDVKKPERDEWDNGLTAMQCALQLEKKVNQALLDLHKVASEKGDPHLCDFLETHYLEEQVEAIKKLGDHITNLTKMDAGNNRMSRLRPLRSLVTTSPTSPRWMLATTGWQSICLTSTPWMAAAKCSPLIICMLQSAFKSLLNQVLRADYVFMTQLIYRIVKPFSCLKCTSKG